MRRKFTDAFLDDAIKLFSVEPGLKEVAQKLGVNADALSAKLRDRGFIIPKRPSKPRKNLPNAKIVADYLAGKSELELSKEYGVARTAIRPRLLAAGIQIRGPRDAGLLSAATYTPEERKKRVQAAHDARRGSKASQQEQESRALAKFTRAGAVSIGVGEDVFAEQLQARGIDFIRQYPVGAYNIDFLVGNVAVELKSGTAASSYAFSEARQGRIKEISNAGFACIYVCFQTEETMLGNIDKIISLIHECSCLPSASSQYRVVWCRFKDCALGRNERQQFTRVEVPVELLCSTRVFDA